MTVSKRSEVHKKIIVRKQKKKIERQNHVTSALQTDGQKDRQKDRHRSYRAVLLKNAMYNFQEFKYK